MAKLPKSIKIGPYNYDILEQDNLVDPENKPVWGLCEYHKQNIILNRNAPNDRKKVILYHELLHAAWELLGLPEKGADEEEVIVRMAPFLLQVMIDNPKLKAYLYE